MNEPLIRLLNKWQRGVYISMIFGIVLAVVSMGHLILIKSGSPHTILGPNFAAVDQQIQDRLAQIEAYRPATAMERDLKIWAEKFAQMSQFQNGAIWGLLEVFLGAVVWAMAMILFSGAGGMLLVIHQIKKLEAV